MDLSPEALKLVVGKLITLILSVAVHEFGHAIVADKLGDRLPRQQGRVTLNPFAHADPIGTLALPGVVLLASGGASTGFGWGRPVQTQPMAYTRRFSMRTGHMFVALAGPMMNLFFGLFLALVLFILVQTGVFTVAAVLTEGTLASMLGDAVRLNFVLMFFNLLPTPPLDGGAVVEGLLPTRYQRHYHEYAKYGIFLAAAVIMIPTLSAIFMWPANQLYIFVVKAVLGL